MDTDKNGLMDRWISELMNTRAVNSVIQKSTNPYLQNPCSSVVKKLLSEPH